MKEMNSLLRDLGEVLKSDSLLRSRTDISVISFGGTVQTEVSFRPAIYYEAPLLKAAGLSVMNEAIETGLDALEACKYEYRSRGVNYVIPLLFLLTGGTPGDPEREASAKARLREAIRMRNVLFVPMVTGTNADEEKLREYYPPEAASRPVLKADADTIREAFMWPGGRDPCHTRDRPDCGAKITVPNIPDLHIEI